MILRCFYLVVAFLTLTIRPLFAQTATALAGPLKAIAAELKPVKGADRDIVQQVSVSPFSPHRALFTLTITDKKGPKEEGYELNLADLDIPVYEPKKDVIQILLKTRGNAKFIRTVAGSQPTGYDNRLTLFAENIDNARALTEAMRQAIPAAVKMTETRFNPGSTAEALATYLCANVGNSNLGNESYEQVLTQSSRSNPLKIKAVQRKTGSKGKVEETTAYFNLGDLDDRSVELGVKGIWAYVEVSTRNRQNFISTWADGKLQGNERSATFYFADLEKARDCRAALQKLLPAAAQRQQQLAPAYPTAEVLRQLSEAVRPVGEGDDPLGQQLSPACQTTLTLTNAKGVVDEYRFFWGDMAEKAVKFEAGRRRFVLGFETQNKLKYIEHLKNGERQSYVSRIEVEADDIETLRYLPGPLEKAIVACRNTRTIVVPQGGLSEKLAFIGGQLTDVAKGQAILSQQLKATSGCVVELTRTTADAKKPLDERFEFSLAEIDPASVELDIAGDDASIQLRTRNKEKSIKTYKNGTPSSYVSEVRVPVTNIEAGLTLREAFKQVVGLCKK